MSLNVNEWRILKEKIEVLAGERGDPQKAAIRMAYIKSLQELVGRLSGSATEVQNRINVLSQQVGGTQTEIDAANAALDQLNLDIAALQTDINRIDTLETNYTALDGEVTTLQTNFTALQTDVNAVVIPAATATAVSAAPTAAQYNVLLDNVNALRTALTDLKNAIL